MAFERTGQPRPHCGEDARQDFAVVEFGKRGKAWPLADDEPHDLLAMGAVDFADKNLDRLIDDRAQRQIARQRSLKSSDHGIELEAYQFLKQRLLVGEVEIDRALGDAGAARHVVEPRGSEAAGRKFIERRAKGRLPPRRRFRSPDALAGCRGEATSAAGGGTAAPFLRSLCH